MTKSSNKAQTARVCSAATGAPYVECLKWFDRGLISRRQPVPEPQTAPQRRLEAIVAHELAEAFRDVQLDGALLGIRKAKLADNGFLELDIHPVMAYALVHRILPHNDRNYGGLRGVPGLRPAANPSDGALVLNDLTSAAGLALSVSADFSLSPVRFDDDGDNYEAIWHDHANELHDEEREFIDSWERSFDAANGRRRDLVLSRLLRRPGVLQCMGATHGLANTYTHWTRDLVIEWCCGASKSEAELRLRKSGFFANLDGLDVDESEFEGKIWWGDTGVLLKRISCYVPDDWSSNVAASYKIDAVVGRYPRGHRHPVDLMKTSPVDLEKIIQALLIRMGMMADKIRFPDHHFDLGSTENPKSSADCVVQVKRTERAIGTMAVEKLADAIGRRQIGRAIIVSTGGFTTAARQLATQHAHIQLIDGNQLEMLLREHLRIEWRSS
ncbi:restriction endonuclease [Nocardia suismassiliense]|uniref:Restriction endonuclease n=1 Tax=Nocardia suismassiliense TaxID=2077092 RepID=A0ABW6R175_9NOCA